MKATESIDHWIYVTCITCSTVALHESLHYAQIFVLDPGPFNIQTKKRTYRSGYQVKNNDGYINSEKMTLKMTLKKFKITEKAS